MLLCRYCLICSAGNFSKTAGNRHMSEDMTSLCGDCYCNSVAAPHSLSKYTLLPTSPLGKAGAMYPQNSRFPSEPQGLFMFSSLITWSQRALKRFDSP